MILWQCLLLLLPLPDSNFSCFLHSFCWSASLQVINQSCAIRIYFKYSYLHKTFMVLHGPSWFHSDNHKWGNSFHWKFHTSTAAEGSLLKNISKAICKMESEISWISPRCHNRSTESWVTCPEVKAARLWHVLTVNFFLKVNERELRLRERVPLCYVPKALSCQQENKISAKAFQRTAS